MVDLRLSGWACSTSMIVCCLKYVVEKTMNDLSELTCLVCFGCVIQFDSTVSNHHGAHITRHIQQDACFRGSLAIQCESFHVVSFAHVLFFIHRTPAPIRFLRQEWDSTRTDLRICGLQSHFLETHIPLQHRLCNFVEGVSPMNTS